MCSKFSKNLRFLILNYLYYYSLRAESFVHVLRGKHVFVFSEKYFFKDSGTGDGDRHP